MAADGDIVLNLSLDDKNFAITVKNSGKLLRELRGDLDRTATGVESVKKHFGSFSTTLRHTVMSLAAVRFAAMDFYDVFLRLPSAVLETSGEIERLTKLMGGLSNATTDVARQNEALANTKFVLNLAKNAPFEIKALADSLVKLKSGGLDPTNGSMQALVDSVARFGGTSESLHRASVAIQQMSGKGVISMEELRQQLGEAVPTAMKMMAEGMGMSMADLTKQVSLGAVQSGDALRRMFTVMEFYNKGAAAEMMDTWTGMTSRLKTEWVLLQTEIGKAGFADAAKEQLRDLIKVMSSPQGIAMAKQFGYNLASLVKTLRMVADAIIENWSSLKLLGQVLIAVFAARKIIEFGNAMKATLVATSAATAATMKKYQQETALKAQQVANIAAADAKAAADKLATDSAALANSRAHYAKLKAMHAAHLAEIRKLDAANEISRARLANGGTFETAAIRARDERIKALRQEDREYKKLMKSEKDLQATYTSGLFAAQQQALAKDKIAKAAQNAANNLGVMSKVGAGLRVAMGALGGPIGLVTTALMLGIPAWLNWGNAGEKAIQKIRDALNSGTATEDTINLINKQLIEKRRELYELENSRKSISILPANPMDVQRDAVLKKQLEMDIKELERNLSEAKTQKFQNEANARFSASQSEFERQETEIRKRFTSEAGELNARYQQRLALIKKGSKEEADTEKQRSVELRNIMIAQGEALHKVALQQHNKAKLAFDHAKKSGNSAETELAKQYLEQVNAKLLETARFREETAHLLTDPQFKVDKIKKPDPLTQALEQSRADLASAQIKLEDLEDGIITFQRLREAAIAKVEGDRLSGRYSQKDERGNFVPPSRDNKVLAEIADNEARIDQINRETQAMKALNGLKALSQAELQTSAERFKNPFGDAETTGVHKLQRQLAALKQTLVEGSPAMAEFSKHAGEIISEQAIADLNNFAAGFRTMNADMKIAIEDSEVAKKQMSYDAELARLKSAMEMRRQAILQNTRLTASEVAALTLKAEEELNENLRLRFEKHMKDMRTPLQQLTVNWLQTTDRLRDASTRWANDSMDALVQFVKGGKLEWRSLVDSILTDILRIQLQKTAGRALNNALEAGIGALGKMFGMQDALGAAGIGGNSLPIDPVTGAVMTMSVLDTRMSGAMSEAINKQKDVFKNTQQRLENVWVSVKSGFTNVWDSMGRMISSLGSGLAGLFSNLAGGLGSFMSGFVGGGKRGILGSIIDIVGTGISGALGAMGGGAGASVGKGIMASTSNGASAAFGDISGSLFKSFKFAKGGIMSNLGAMPLHTYATGGIANSPQLAVFGEGRRPEAYVPLPDGRTIPVTLSGGAGAPIVTIQIVVNNDGGEKQSSNGDDAPVWNRIAQRVKTVVREEMVVQKRPGGLLAK